MNLRFNPADLPAPARALRAEVRAFIRQEIASGSFIPKCDSWQCGHSPAFSRKLAAKGWVGMTFPTRYGGGGRSAVERFAVVAELLAAGAPVAAHWFADRQFGPALLKHGSEEQRQRFVPGMAAGETYFSIGMSEPDTGSDLASVRTRATAVDGGWSVTGAKVWTSHAHLAHFLVALCRTSESANRHEGLSQLIIDLQSPGVEVRPIPLMTGDAHFCEIRLDGVFVPADMLLGNPGDGWAQVVQELAFERSGPERFLSPFPLFHALVAAVGEEPSSQEAEAIGRLTARAMALYNLSYSVAQTIDAKGAPAIEAALVKDLGTRFEHDLVELARLTVARERAPERFRTLLDQALLNSPGFTLRGGTTEILHGIMAKGLRPS